MTVSVITGCSTGIGYAAALRLAADGHRVVATMRDPSACDLEVVAKEQGLDLETRALDVTDGAAVEQLVADVLSAHGQIDVLVNNAGIGGGGPVEETPFEDFRRMMETNFFGALRCMQAVVPGMRERGSGWIVNVTSQAGRFAAPCMGAYAASKFALEAASESLSVELAPFGVRVALIEPGAIMTPIWQKVDTTPPAGPYIAARKRLTRTVMTELGHASSADEVADCISLAMTTTEPRLRWLVGRGADRNIALRDALSDEEWRDIWNAPNEEFLPKMFGDDA
jgi:NAD(P)-dependent dehydrogenase (short-subunit alcohol dehydrogenase family)